MCNNEIIHTFVEVFQRRTERQAHKVMARGIKQIPAMRRVDIEENTGYHDTFFLEELFKESLIKVL